MNPLVALRKELKENANEQAGLKAGRFFKEPIKPYGIKTGLVRKISGRHFGKLQKKPKHELFLFCEDLFKSGFLEESLIAADWAYRVRGSFEEEDLWLFERWIEKYLTNWAACDTFCNHTMGYYFEKYPYRVKHLMEWTGSGNRWKKRASAVCIIIPAKKGMFLEEAFEISRLLMHDKDDLVQKGYGWLLKEESRKHPKEIYQFALKYKDTLPRTAYRYAIELLPTPWKKEAMKRA